MLAILQYRGTIQALLAAAMVFVAWQRGAGPERWTSGVLLAMIAALWTYKAMASPSLFWVTAGYATIEPVFLLIDTAAFLALAVIAIRANRFYPIPMAGFQLVALGTHFASESTQMRFPTAYWVANVLPFYCMMVALASGLWAHTRRRGRMGSYPSWRASSAPLPDRSRATPLPH